MPSRSELKKVQSLVNELMASDLQAMKSGKLKPSQVAANAEKLAGDAEGEAAKFLLYKGAFGLYVQGGSYDEALSAIDHLNAAVRGIPDKVLAEILREKLKRIPKKNGSAIFNRYDGICRRMAAAEERGKLEKQLKASPADKQTRRLLAVRCAQMGDWEAAREHFSKLRGKEADAVKAEGSNFAEAADFWWGYQPGVDGVDEEPFRGYAVLLDGGGHGVVEVARAHVVRQDHPVHGQGGGQLREAADVVLVEVGQDHQIQLLHLELLQGLQDIVPVVLLARVDKHVVPVEGQQRTVRLADGEGADVHAADRLGGAAKEHREAYADGKNGFHVNQCTEKMPGWQVKLR